MKIGLVGKIIVGLLTAWVVISPLVYLMIWFFSITSFAATENQSQSSPNTIGAFFITTIIFILCSSSITVGMQAFYMVHIILNKSGGDVPRAILGVGLFLLPFLAMPVYYFIYILPSQPPSWALAATPTNTAVTP